VVDTSADGLKPALSQPKQTPNQNIQGSKINTLMPDSSLYNHFRQRGLTRSQRHFSHHWLNSAENYLSLRGEREASSNVLVGLFQKLWREGRLLLAVKVAWTILWLPEAAR
jgi:hypothetical protein